MSFFVAHTDLLEMATNEQASRQGELLSETIPFIVIATLAVIARYFSVRLRPASLGAEDYVCCLALVRSLLPSYASL